MSWCYRFMKIRATPITPTQLARRTDALKPVTDRTERAIELAWKLLSSGVSPGNAMRDRLWCSVTEPSLSSLLLVHDPFSGDSEPSSVEGGTHGCVRRVCRANYP